MPLVIPQPLSVEEWAERPVDEKDVLAILDSSVWAPNDGLREPWRFIYINGIDGKNALPGHPYAPAHLIVVASLNESSHKQVEDLCAVFALIQNFRLLASEYQLCVRTVIETGMHAADLQTRFRLGQQERIAAVLDLGYAGAASSQATDRANIQLQIDAF
ncbi:hypothetical protein [Paenibacillus radicis (ex Gao et al. 2016)]|uniref:NAD(P)H nitroreductase YfhC n=1 Tax=Paenibacillus radicis (ex Gao et al. 2016) TaxID=1737354 RepID=A0A917GQ10_9BACL|nr:hypothetical protein [Paenibacillus radicis (ex Gao et al. 2016)]GGG53040.1 putative NAD(P)H nitroreductase YfhC [Paenibacillus radicis (ex Gao et al. 2016)]